MADNKKITEFPRSTPSGGLNLVAATGLNNYQVSYSDFSEYSSLGTQSGTFLSTLTISGSPVATGSGSSSATPEWALHWSGAPASINAPGSSGDIAFDENYFYLRVGDSPNEDDEKVVQVEAGEDHCLFLSNSGKVYGCGSNTYSQLGTGASLTNTLVPMYITGDDVILVRAGGYESMFLTKDGDVYGCGRNNFSTLGLGTTSVTPYPTYITGGVTGLSIGYSHTLFQSGNDMYGCGINTFSKYGPTYSTVPIFVTGDVAIGRNTFVAGYHHSVFINKDDGYYYGVGLNQTNTFAGATVTASVGTIANPIRCSGNTAEVSAGDQMTAMMDNVGNGYTIGFGGQGAQLNGGSANVPSPRKFSGDINTITVGPNNIVSVLKENGDLFNGGSNGQGALGRQTFTPAGLEYVTGNVSGLSPNSHGGRTNPYVTPNGAAFSCGDNASGQLGTGALLPVDTNGTNTFFYVSGRNDVSNSWKRAPLSSF